MLPEDTEAVLPNFASGEFPVSCLIHATRALLSSVSLEGCGGGVGGPRQGTETEQFNSWRTALIEGSLMLSSIEITSCSAKVGIAESNCSSKGSHNENAPFISDKDFLQALSEKSTLGLDIRI